jgi:hypothetical protein
MGLRTPIFHDDDHWVALAAKTRYDLPAKDVPCQIKSMQLWLDRLGRDEKWHQTAFGCSLAAFIESNTEWPLRGWVGLILEATVGSH